MDQLLNLCGSGDVSKQNAECVDFDPWTVERLRLFFGDLPLLQWFNPAAPRIKQGEVVPDKMM
ncbi:hypothetical protein [Marinospirillum sp.]|uniref:hypothetical protein n=1 Tax=Marinospirillum sp. TaxID=2183934 RepID=UPI0025B7DA28|nr:hypothetical protein [Marinospirillum sp.]